MRLRGSVPSALAGVAVLVLLAGCSSGTGTDDLPTREPATAAIASPPTTPPDGRVFPLVGPIAALQAEFGTGLLAALDGATLSLIDPAPNPPAVRTVTLPVRASGLAQGAPGEILATAPNRVLRVDAGSGAVREVVVDGEVTAVRPRDGGTLLVGTGDGRVRVVSPGGEDIVTVSGLVSADELAVVGDTVTVLDRHQTSITELELGSDRLGLALRAGDGATDMLADTRGRVLVTDTAGGELLVYSPGPLVLRQRFPVRSSPYALAYDQQSDTVWVTCTQSNEVVGFELSTGIPKEVGRYSTVRQPNSVTIEQRTGDMFVGSATGDGLQRIGADDRKKGH